MRLFKPRGVGDERDIADGTPRDQSEAVDEHAVFASTDARLAFLQRVEIIRGTAGGVERMSSALYPVPANAAPATTVMITITLKRKSPASFA